MKKDDGSLQYEGNITPLMQLLLRRRSVRKFDAGQASDEQMALISARADQFADVAGLRRARIEMIVEEEQVDAIIKAAMKGVVGKINPWLAFTKARKLILCGAMYGQEDDQQEVDRALKEAAMLMEVAILAATECGLGTCWMAGINHDEVGKAHELADRAQLVAMSPLGTVPQKKGFSWDAFSYHLVSKRRKPLTKLWMQEGWEQPAPQVAPAAETTAQEPDGTDVLEPLIAGLQAQGEPAELASEVSQEALSAILGAARVAPSADNLQTWRFIEVRDSERKQALAEHVEANLAEAITRASAVLVTVGITRVVSRVKREQPFVMVDVPIAVSHMLLQAQELGVEVAWALSCDEDGVRSLLGIPESARIIALLALG